MGSQHFSLKWNNHQRNMLTTFERLLSNEALVDVTLACEGLSLKAHKMVLSASSPFFQNLFLENPCKHPVVIMQDVKFAHLKAIVEFVYRGEVTVPQDELTTLLKTAETLKVKGLADLSDDDGQPSGTEQDSEKYSVIPSISSKVQTRSKTDHPQLTFESKHNQHWISNDSNISGSDELSSPRIQEQNFRTEMALEPEVQISVKDEHFGAFDVQSQLSVQSTGLQQDGKVTNCRSARCLSDENSHDRTSLDSSAQSLASHLDDAPSSEIPKKIKIVESGSCANQTLLPHLVGLLSEPCTSAQASQGRDPCSSTSVFGNAGKNDSLEAYSEEDDSYLEYHDTSLSITQIEQNMDSKNDVLSANSTVLSDQRNDLRKAPKKLKDCIQTANKKFSAAERPFACNSCGKRFTQKSNLQMHQQTHSGNKPNKCELCGARFTRSRDLARHHLIHTGEKPFECGTCGKRFNRNSHVRRHERLVHCKEKLSLIPIDKSPC